MRTNASTILCLCAAALLLPAIVPVQEHLTASKDASWFKERMSYLPRTDKIVPFIPGFRTTLAAYLWIRTMLYFGEHYEKDSDFRWLVTMVDMVTKLNPHLYPAYEFAGVILPTLGDDPDAARIILERGLTHLGAKQYRIAFYLGWLYYDHYRDYERAADYLALAAVHEDAPGYLAALAASSYNEAGRRATSIRFLLRLRESSRNPSVQRVVEHKLKELIEEKRTPERKRRDSHGRTM
ncbi:MAG: hypothetical protein GF344_12915 [Chitinivibrionales bacterium]|nr:hypothetical protein [Chitinivibrionales bacterium]MBD3357641.1 hypothetical protein [Chitinivibrionales bacterium]